MPNAKKAQRRKTIDKVLTGLGVMAAVVLLAAGGLAWWTYHFTTKNVHDELMSQKVYFPPKGSAALDPKEFPTLQKYAGQQVDNGPKAKAFANDFIAKHLEKVAGGKTYAEVSTEALANPTNQQLQQQAQTLFRGETLRGLLLGDAYAFWTVGHIAQIAALILFAAGGVMAVLVLLGFWHLMITRA
jgi:cytoskeletal protein RodZ